MEYEFQYSKFTILAEISIYSKQALEENLDWEEIQWSQTSVWVRGKEYPLARAHFLASN